MAPFFQAVVSVIERILKRWDNDDTELVLRWRIWRLSWLPYRTAEFLGYDPVTLDISLGPWKWHRPSRLLRQRP